MRLGSVIYVPRKTHKLKTCILISILLLMISLIAVLTVSAVAGLKLMHPARDGLKAFSSNIAPDIMDIKFQSADESTNLSGWFFQVKNSDKAVILVHSYGKNRLQYGEDSMDMIKQFMQKGFNVLTFDLRNSGKSGGETFSLGYHEQKDVLGAIKKAKALGQKHIVLMGFSSGASTCLLAASGNPDVEAIIADSPYANIHDFIDSGLTPMKLPSFPFNQTITLFLKFFGNIEINKASPENVMKSIVSKPILLIHNEDDTHIPISNSHQLKLLYIGSGGKNIALWGVENAGHIGGYPKYPSIYMDQVFRFLETVFED